MKVELIPHSQATSSYGLLEDVIKAIEEEPRRFYWSNWIIDAESHWEPNKPACGTLACVHGWVDLLTSDNPRATNGCDAEVWFPMDVQLQEDFEKLAYANGEFSGIEDMDEFDDGSYVDRDENETQEQYAARGIKAIRLFMSRYEQELRNHAIRIPARRV